jgi:hypothetical protein
MSATYSRHFAIFERRPDNPRFLYLRRLESNATENRIKYVKSHVFDKSRFKEDILVDKALKEKLYFLCLVCLIAILAENDQCLPVVLTQIWPKYHCSRQDSLVRSEKVDPAAKQIKNVV